MSLSRMKQFVTERYFAIKLVSINLRNGKSEMPFHYSKFSLNCHAQVLVLKGPEQTKPMILIQVQVIGPVNFLCSMNNISMYSIPP